MGFNLELAQIFSLASAVAIVALPLAFAVFFALIYSPKIKKHIENQLEICTNAWIELQLVFSFCYFNQDYTDLALKVLRANRHWVYFNFFDTFCDDVVKSGSDDFIFTEWSTFGFKNIFTICLFSVFYLIFYLICKIFIIKSNLTRFLEFEAGLLLVKISTFRVALALCIEVYRLVGGEQGGYSTAIVLFVAFIFLGIVPFGKIFYLRLRYLGNLEADKPMRIFGSEYKMFKTCWREFHFLPERSCLVISAASIVFLKYFETAQIFIVLACLVMLTGYSIILKPFRDVRNNLHYCTSRTFITAIFCTVLGRHYYSEDLFLNYSLLILLFLFNSIKLSFILYELHLSLSKIRVLLSSSFSDNQDLVSGSDTQKLDLIQNSNDLTLIPSNRLNEEIGELNREATYNSSKKRIKRGITAESSSDSIDPRLTRKRASRKKKNQNE